MALGPGAGVGRLEGEVELEGADGFEFGFGCGFDFDFGCEEGYGYGLGEGGVGEEGSGGYSRDGLAERGCMPRRGYPGHGG